MPITILDYVKSVVGDKDLYTVEDCLASGVDIMGGCQGCHAVIGCYNAYPSTSGYWRCADCIGDDGYATVADFTASRGSIATCPACGNTDNISETRVTTGERTEGYALECGDCGRDLAAMNTASALEWLDATFDTRRRKAFDRDFRNRARCSRSKASWTPVQSMHVCSGDYDDPLRWWL